MTAPTIHLTLVPGASVAEADGALAIKGRRFDHRLTGLTQGSVAALRALADGPVDEDALSSPVIAAEGLRGLMALERAKYQMHGLGMIRRTALRDGVPLATLHPMTFGPVFISGAVERGRAYELSRFACLRRVDGEVELECPLSTARVICHDARVAALIAALALPRSVSEAAALAGLSEEVTAELLDMFLHIRAVTAQGNGASPEVDLEHALAGWEFHDLLFHARSRQGRHDGPYGATFHMKGRVPPPPMAAPRSWAHDIPLHVPNLDDLRERDPPFADVVERRRSIRDYAASPVTVAALGEFLYRTARVKHVLTSLPGEMDLSLRPYPGGGAIHELEIYAVVGGCEGLERGLYHYDPVSHHLGLVIPEDKRTIDLLDIGWRTADRKSKPQIFFVITARFRRLQWKYQSVAYAVILKNVGVLYEAMYLTATAMGLAPCSLGGGIVDPFCQAVGLDPFDEAPVGEFMLGSRGSPA